MDGKGSQLQAVLSSWLISGAMSLCPERETEVQLRGVNWRGAEESPLCYGTLKIASGCDAGGGRERFPETGRLLSPVLYSHGPGS